MARCAVPAPAGRKGRGKTSLFRRLTLRLATGTAQRAAPTHSVCERHNPAKWSQRWVFEDGSSSGRFDFGRTIHGV
jgi:hypothetical protein